VTTTGMLRIETTGLPREQCHCWDQIAGGYRALDMKVREGDGNGEARVGEST
jgi:hypothetical protein